MSYYPSFKDRSDVIEYLINESEEDFNPEELAELSNEDLFDELLRREGVIGFTYFILGAVKALDLGPKATTPAASKKVKVLAKTEGPSTWVWVISYNNRKFRITSTFTNGTPLGFNYKCCLSVMAPSGTWSNVTDNREIGLRWENLYYLDPEDPRKAEQAKKAYEAFLKYVKAVY